MADDFLYDVFLSYNSKDKSRVRQLAGRLRDAGLSVWFDEWLIRPGDDIYLAIEHGLGAARVLVLCLSPAALGSDWVMLERATVLFRDPTNIGRRFIPLLLADCKLPDTLRRYRYVDFRRETKTAFDELIDACRPVSKKTSPKVPVKLGKKSAKKPAKPQEQVTPFTTPKTNKSPLTVDEIKALPLRAIVALAVRCACRVQPRFQFIQNDHESQSHTQALNRALRGAEVFAAGEEFDKSTMDGVSDAKKYAEWQTTAPYEYEKFAYMGGAMYAAEAVSLAANSADNASRGDAEKSATLAIEAIEAAHGSEYYFSLWSDVDYTLRVDLSHNDAARDAAHMYIAARGDYERLLLLKLGKFPEAGEGVDFANLKETGE